jgi:hypothetical protein
LSVVRLARTLSLVLALAALVAGCNTPPPGPGAIAQNYVNALAAGNYAGACGTLSGKARRALSAAMKSSAGCPVLLARCVPTNASVLKHDQVQLFYSSVDERISGSHASVTTTGTAVANRVKRVTLVQQHGVWHLTSYGEQRCSAGHTRVRHKSTR